MVCQNLTEITEITEINKLLFSPYGAFSSDGRKACFRSLEVSLLKFGNKASIWPKLRL